MIRPPVQWTLADVSCCPSLGCLVRFRLAGFYGGALRTESVKSTVKMWCR
jgi:hypothetical protein